MGLIQRLGLGLGRLKLAFEVVVGNPGIIDNTLDNPFCGYHRNILTLGVQLLYRKIVNKLLRWPKTVIIIERFQNCQNCIMVKIIKKFICEVLSSIV